MWLKFGIIAGVGLFSALLFSLNQYTNLHRKNNTGWAVRDFFYSSSSKIIKPILCAFWSIPSDYWNQNHTESLISKPVTIRRDKFGIPYISADNDLDAFYGEGFFHATERAWQMELLRLLSMGRMSELVGKEALHMDVFSRTLGFNRAAKRKLKNMSEKERLYWQAYADGVTAGFKALPVKPMEFFMLSYNFNSVWTIEDSVSVFTTISYMMTCGKMAEVSRLILSTQLPDHIFKLLDIQYDSSIPYSNPEGPGAVLYNLQGEKIDFFRDKINIKNASTFFNFYDLEEKNNIHNKFTRDETILNKILQHFNKNIKPISAAGSNAWAISGKYTESGKPLVAGDPHIESSAPGFFVPMSLESKKKINGEEEEMHCIGASMPGVPGIIMGHNMFVAWSVTLSFFDQEDLFILQTSDDNMKYKYNNTMHHFFVNEEIFYSKGEKDPYIWSVRESHHGPVMSDVAPFLNYLVGNNSNHVVALASTALKARFNFSFFLDLLRVKSAKDMLFLGKEFQIGSYSIVAADTEGNIESVQIGSVPRRKDTSKSFFKDGSKTDEDWNSILSHEELPHLMNPSRGFVFTANGPLGIDTHSKYGNHFDCGQRASRIYDYLQNFTSSGKKVGVKDFQSMQLDTYRVVGCELKNFIKSFFNKEKNNTICSSFGVNEEVIEKIVEPLKNWNCYLDADSSAATINEVWLQFLAQDLFKIAGYSEMALSAFLGDTFNFYFVTINEFASNWPPRIVSLLKNEQNLKRIIKQQNAQQMLACTSLNHTYHFLNKYSSDSENWKWGNVRAHIIPHLFCKISPFMKHLFCPDRVVRGGGYSINAMFTHKHILEADDPQGSSRFNEIAEESALRMVLDVGKWENSRWIVPIGVSGWFCSEHYNDQVEFFSKGVLHPMLWNENDVSAATVTTMRLIPASKEK